MQHCTSHRLHIIYCREEVSSFFEEMDRDYDGKLSFAEFMGEVGGTGLDCVISSCLFPGDPAGAALPDHGQGRQREHHQARESCPGLEGLSALSSRCVISVLPCQPRAIREIQSKSMHRIIHLWLKLWCLTFELETIGFQSLNIPVPPLQHKKITFSRNFWQFVKIFLKNRLFEGPGRI